MTDEIDRLLRAADPVTESRLSGLAQPLDELRAAVVAGRRPATVSRRWLSAAVLAAVVVGATAVVVPHTVERSRALAPGAPVAAASDPPTDNASTAGRVSASGDPDDVAGLDADIPRLLLPAPWRVAPLEGDLTARYGVLDISDGDREVRLSWMPREIFGDLDAGVASSDPLPVQVAGHDAYVFDEDRRAPDEEPSPGEVLAFWRDGDVVFTARGRGIAPNTAAAFARVLAQLEEADAATWLAALPADAVLPGERGPVVDDMLRDVPVPPGVDVDVLRRDGRVGANRYQVGAHVTGAVACGWVERWLVATDRGDDRVAGRAVTAMASSHDWAVLREMQAEGGWPEAVWEYADAMRTGEPITGGRDLTIRESYADALGCDPP